MPVFLVAWLVLLIAREDVSALVLVSVVGREPRAEADVVMKDV
jgi:hypothetical protein